ncbi:hypothetical protein CHU32_13840 [Superficieibacter electus]|uniref:Uncharacterized protein n=1 Tax=Superficieibacter electus TaxID=2022662 RepID=A0A2P5GP89_9ENTR|nr:hypothetical protein [Superficieibacter electus]POP44957.1 hypothetical protein CHU33_10915 [Superficieibacter electus]POP48344.1 hypothetical protein CHU32_13840 [Superficieibacter electus]
MKVDFNDQGAVSTITVTSTVFEFRKHNRVVDTTLFSTPAIVVNRTGVFFLRSVFSGKSRDILRAYKTVQREAAR